MDENVALSAVINLVPNWYLADVGMYEHRLSVSGIEAKFFSHRALTKRLRILLETMQEELSVVIKAAEPLSKATAISFIQEYFAKSWLKLVEPDINWEKLIDYLNELSERTYENQRVSYNFMICEGAGYDGLTKPEIQKIFDPLATSMHTFMRVNRDIEFLGFEEICWDNVKDTEGYKLHPEFLQPIASNTKSGEYSVHQTGRGDLIIITPQGLIAAKRKGRWKIYDVNSFKIEIVNSIIETLNGNRVRDYRVGCNLFEVMFDLSFKRHGALLVYDPDRKVVQRIINKGSIITSDNPEPDQARFMLKQSIRDIRMGDIPYHARKKRLLLEIASIDGAVLFTNNEILSFGSMIATHEDAKAEVGARSTAARSALYWGGLPIKVSADGEISIYFKSFDQLNKSCEAKFEFL